MPVSNMKIRAVLPYLLFVLALLPFVFQAALFYHYTNDDAYITYRYSYNLVRGMGPYFNAGEHFEGYTNFLQMLQTAALIRVFGPGPAPGISKFLGVLYGAGCVLLTFAIFLLLFPGKSREFSRILSLAGAAAASAIVSVSPGFAVNSTSGLETTMFTFFLCLGIFLGMRELLRERWHGSGIAFALAELTRPEGSLLFAVFWVACAAVAMAGMPEKKASGARSGFFSRFVQEKRFRLILLNGLLVTGVFLAHMAFRYVMYDGELLPNTYYAKKGGFWGFSPWQYANKGLFIPLLGAGGIVAALAGFLANFRRLPRVLPCVAAVAVTGVLMPFIAGTDWMVGFRLMTPYLPAAAVVAAGGWMLLISRIKKTGPLVAVLFLAGITALLWFTQNGLRKSFYHDTVVRARGYQTGHREAATWIHSHARPGDSIALMDIGIIGYVCIDQTIIDITGLTDRHIAKAEGTFLNKNYDPGYIFDRKPRFMIFTLFARGQPYTIPKPGIQFQPWSGMEARLLEDPRFRQFYPRIRTLPSGEPVDWLDSFAAQIGAERMFEHGHPGLHCVQAVFCRRTEPVE